MEFKFIRISSQNQNLLSFDLAPNHNFFKESTANFNVKHNLIRLSIAPLKKSSNYIEFPFCTEDYHSHMDYSNDAIAPKGGCANKASSFQELWKCNFSPKHTYW